MDIGGEHGESMNNKKRKQNEFPSGALRKGKWTPEEDEILINYVKKNGEGNWNLIYKNFVLNRCERSCRQRWVNHLRPNLKKCMITDEEEAIIVKLHDKFGNKWAMITSQLPGRTDNEIKNFWITRMNRRNKAGLPLYPIKMKNPNPRSTGNQCYQ